MDIQDVEKHDHIEEFRRQFTPELFEQVSKWRRLGFWVVSLASRIMVICTRKQAAGAPMTHRIHRTYVTTYHVAF